MLDIKKQFREFVKIFIGRDISISENDPRLNADFNYSNLQFNIVAGVLLCIISFIGLIGTHAPFSEGNVIPRINATAVYLTILFINLLFTVILYRELGRFNENAWKRTERICAWFMGMNMVLASLTFYSTQKHSSFFFEYILVTIIILLIPNVKLMIFFLNVAINVISAVLILFFARHMIAWQDVVDMIALFIICGFVNRVRWLSFVRAEENKLASEKKRDELYHDSRIDSITGLLNRTALRSDFPDFVGRSLCIAMIDIDSFKQCNDTYGHAYGDRMLHELGGRLQMVFDGRKDRCYRYGGDEFLIISECEDRNLFYKNLSFLSDFKENKPEEPKITCGIGYCCGTVNAEGELRSMIQTADGYLYQAKSAGAGRMAGSLDPIDNQRRLSGKTDNAIDLIKDVGYASEIFQQEKMAYKSWNIAYLNVNHYAEINEELGYREGRALLEKISKIIFRYFPHAVMVNREVDHFVLFSTIPEKDFINKIRCVQSEVLNLEEKHMIIFRAGIFRHEAADPPANFAMGMYRAKYASDAALDAFAEKRYLCIYDTDMEQKRANEIFVHNAFSAALESGYIVPYYQPIVGSLSGATCGYEALSRWIDPQKGLISPGSYIPYLEKTGEICRLDLHILELVCRDICDHRKQFPEKIFVNVNISQRDFQFVNLPEEIDRIVSEYHVPKDQLQLEITESALADSRLLGAAIFQLRKLGFRIWMDDFGVGEASLSAFRTNKVTGVKLDQSFFEDIENQRTQIMIRSIIDMSHETECMMIAEGIENLEQLRCARQCGVNFIQGFYFSRPLSLAELLASSFVRDLTNANIDQYYQSAAAVPLGTMYKSDFYLTEESRCHVFFRAVVELGDDIRVLRADDGMEELLREYVEINGSDCIMKNNCEIASLFRESAEKVRANHHVCDFQVKLGLGMLHGQIAMLAEDLECGKTAYVMNLTDCILIYQN